MTQRFIVENEIPTGYLEQIRDFIMKVMEEEQAKEAFTLGVSGGASSSTASSSSSSAAAAASSTSRRTLLPRLGTLPGLAPVSIAPLKSFKAVHDAILAKNDQVAAESDAAVSALALTMDERATLQSLFDVLQNEGLYHSSVLPAKAATLIVTKAIHWPGKHSAAVYDLCRKMALHAEGAKTYIAPNLSDMVTSVVTGITSAESGLGPKATGLGFLCNVFARTETVDKALPLITTVASAAQACASFEKPLVRARAALLVSNAAAALAAHTEKRGSKVDDDAFLSGGAVALVAAAAACLKPDDTAESVRVSAACALGTAVLCSDTAKAAGMSSGADALASAVAAAAKDGSQLAATAKDAAQAFKEA